MVPRKKFHKVFYDFSTENYKISSEDIKEYLNKWKKMIYLWTGKLNIKIISYGIKSIYTFNAIPIKTTMVFFYGTYLTKINMEG